MRIFVLTPVILALLIACKPEEEIITGDIAGTVKLYDQYYAAVDAMLGIPVSLTGNNGLSATVNTDESGQFVFKDISYGKYTIAASKEGYYYMPAEKIDHLGGYSATNTEVLLYEVPTFQLEIDSIGFDLTEMLIAVYLKLDGDTLLPPSGIGLYTIVVAGSTPEVSKDEFEAWTAGFITDRWYENTEQTIRVYAKISLFYRYFIDFSAEPVYLRLYPVAWGGFGNTSNPFQFDPLALGKPSNTLSFILNNTTGK